MSAAMWLRLGSGGAELGMGNLANVSISGAFLETSLQLPVNANITLEPLTSAGVALDGLKLAARVARVERRGLGIEWHTMLTPDRLALFEVQVPPPPAWRWPQAS
jgi:PilZ domain